MSNDGDLTLRLTHPSGRVLKTYRTTVRCTDPSADLDDLIDRLHRPFVLDGVSVCAKSVMVVSRGEDAAVLDITVGEGRNRQIRRMCDLAGLTVLRLIRIAEGPLQLGSLPTGAARPLTPLELASLMKEVTL